MKILQIHNRYTRPGGEDVVVSSERDVLHSAGHDVETLEVSNQSGPTAVSSMIVSAWNTRSARRVEEMVQGFGPDVVHVHNTWFRLTSSIYSPLRRHGVPTVVTAHNYRYGCVNGQLYRDGEVCTLCVGRTPLPGVVYGCYRNSVPQSAVAAVSVQLGRVNDFWSASVDRYIAMTTFQRDVLAEIGLPTDKILIKPHFSVDVGLRADRPSDSSTVLFIGRLSPEKGVGLLVDAWEAAAPTNLRLVIVGDGPLRDELTQRKVPSIDFVGWETREAIVARTRGARAVMFPSRWYEPFGLVLIETMATGTPIFAHDIGGIPEVLGVEARSPALVPDDQVGAWSSRIHELDSGRIEVDALGAECRRVYEGRYTPVHGLSALEAAYRSVIR